MIKMEPRQPCRLCGIKPGFWEDGSYYKAASEKSLEGGGWTSLMVGAEPDGTIFLSAMGDDESDHYHPKFCPECGRQLY